MIKAEESVRAGDLAQALSDLQSSVRDDPSNASYRIFLFQLLCVQGNWDRALTQLNTAAELDAGALLLAQTYRELLICEGFRNSVFAGDRAPLIFGEPPQWLAGLIQALPLAASGHGEQARTLTDQALEKAPAVPGTINDTEFEWLCDADMRLGPVIEAVVDGKYYWIPLENIARITLSEPEDLRDLVWLPVEFNWRNEGQSVGFIPTRYPGEETLADPQSAMARKTQWHDLGGEFYVGSGQKTFATAEGDHPILATRSIVLATPDAA